LASTAYHNSSVAEGRLKQFPTTSQKLGGTYAYPLILNDPLHQEMNFLDPFPQDFFTEKNVFVDFFGNA
jgi:hypothetical protein